MSGERLSAIERVALARSRDDLYQEIEPLAQALANLADDCRRAIEERSEQARDLTAAISEGAQRTSEQMIAAATALRQAAGEAQRGASSLRPRIWALVILVALLCSIASPSVYWLWQLHFSEYVAKAASWDKISADYSRLPERDRKTVAHIMGWDR